jgi:hypothetical protein
VIGADQWTWESFFSAPTAPFKRSHQPLGSLNHRRAHERLDNGNADRSMVACGAMHPSGFGLSRLQEQNNILANNLIFVGRTTHSAP